MERTLNSHKMNAAMLILRETEPGVMYRYMANHGYNYSTLALGVVEQTSLAGVVALNFMKATATVNGHPVDDIKIDDILHAMASEYIKVLESQTNGRVISVTRDINYKEAWGFHNNVFKRAGYSPDAWTLNSVFSVLPEADCEIYWKKVLASAGNTQAELELAVNTYVLMRMVQLTGSKSSQQMAQGWLNRIESIETARAVVDFGSAKLEKNIEALFKDLSNYFKGLSGSVLGQPGPQSNFPSPAPTPSPRRTAPVKAPLAPIAAPSPPARHSKRRRRGGRPPTTAGGYNNGGHYGGSGDRLKIDP